MSARLHEYGPKTHKSPMACLAICTACLAFATYAAADVYTSASDGAWTQANTWISTSGGVPGSGDDVVILGTHTVGLIVYGSTDVPTVTVNSLTIMPQGTLQPQYPAGNDGRNMSIYTELPLGSFDPNSFDPNNINPGDWIIDPANFDPNLPTFGVLNFGSILGEDGQMRGGNVLISSVAGSGSFQNQGTIRGGYGDVLGGNVDVFYTDGLALNFGTIAGGDELGTGDVTAGSAVMYAAFLGNVSASVPWLPPGVVAKVEGGAAANGSGGAGFLVGISPAFGYPAAVSNSFDSQVLGGDGSNIDTGLHRGGGDAGALALAPGMLSSASNLDGAVIEGGYGCAGGSAWLFGGMMLNRGTVSDGETDCVPPRPPWTRLEPPDGVIAGPAVVIGDSIEIAGGTSLKFALDTRIIGDPAPISASADIHLVVDASGSIDLSNLDSGGGVFFEADGTISIEADTIWLPPVPPGVDPVPAVGPSDLEEFMSSANPIEWAPGTGAQYRLLYAGHDTDYGVEADETLELFALVANLGNRTEIVHYSIDADPNWLVAPIDVPAQQLTPIDGLIEHLVVHVPDNAVAGDESVITVHVEAIDDPDVSADATIRVRLPALQCPGDITGDGMTDLADLARLLAAYGTSVGEPGYDAAADLNNDGSVDLQDLAILLADYGCGWWW